MLIKLGLLPHRVLESGLCLTLPFSSLLICFTTSATDDKALLAETQIFDVANADQNRKRIKCRLALIADDAFASRCSLMQVARTLPL